MSVYVYTLSDEIQQTSWYDWQVLYILSVVCQIVGINRIGNPGTVIIPNKPAAKCLVVDFLVQN